ncbi:MAG: hypothetical protein JO036_20245 [Candidatus Eremiobacteraeota bacterium]|nr:hypothetical protein [Candidatus Eremiobacteraeota bacterium]
MVRFIGLWLACIVVLVLRRPDLVAHPEFLAEDGVIFFREQLLLGITSLWQPYAGYHHLLARLVPLAGAGLPAVAIPAFYAAVVVALEAACCAAVGALLEEVVARESMRWLIALALAACIPADDVIGSLSNLQWYLALPLLTASVVPFPRRFVRAARVAAPLVGLTTPQGIFALPFAAWRWIRRGERGDAWTPTLYAAASVLNVVTTRDPAGLHPTPGWPLAAAISTCYRVGDALWLGRSGAETIAAHWSAEGAVLGAVTIAALSTLVARVLGPRAALALLFVLFAPIALTMNARDLEGASLAHYALFGGDRYFFTACAALLVATLVAATRLPLPARVIVLVLACATSLFANFREPQPLENDDWPGWAPQVDRWRADLGAGRPTAQLSVPIPPRWQLVLPACRRTAGGTLSCG